MGGGSGGWGGGFVVTKLYIIYKTLTHVKSNVNSICHARGTDGRMNDEHK